MNSLDTDETFLRFSHALTVIRRRAWLLILCALVIAGLAFAYSEQKTKQYTASAALIFSANQLSQQVAGLQAVGNNIDQAAQQDTDVQITQLGDMAARTARTIGRGLTQRAVKNSLSISAVGDTNVVDVSAVAPSPQLAAAIANVYSRVFVAEQQDSDQAYFRSALALVDKELATLSPSQKLTAAGLELEARAQSLGILAELPSGNVEIAQLAGAPTSASSPKTVRNIVLGALLGLVLGLALTLVWERLDRRIRVAEDFETIYGVPLLGLIPEASGLARSRARGSGSGLAPAPAEVEAFRVIRAHLRFFGVDRDIRTLLVCSAASGDGKSTVAVHLAAAAASAGDRVMLLELDLRSPVLADTLGIQRGPGLCDVLIAAVTPDVATQSVEVGVPTDAEAQRRTFDVLVAGDTLPPNPAELLESKPMRALLAQVRSQYDLVVVDTPPLVGVSDTFALLRRVDGVVIVGRVGRSHRDTALRLEKMLATADAPVLGVIANCAKVTAGGYYGYGSYGSAAKRPASV